MLGVYTTIAGAVVGLSFALGLALEWLTAMPEDSALATLGVAAAGVPVALGATFLGATLALHALLSVTHKLRLHRCDHCGRRLAGVRDRCCRTTLMPKGARR